jgi:zinc protease
MKNLGRVFLLLISLIASLFGEEIIHTTLKNGLTIVLKENRTAPVVALRLYVATGSLYEGGYLGSGISHYCEHVICGGSTSKRSKKEQEELIQWLGGAVNAYTARDHTCYYISTLSAYFKEALQFLADIIQNCSFAPEEVLTEKGVIARELALRDDEPTRRVYKIYQELMFKGHPVGLPILGLREFFEKITREDLIKYYRAKYLPRNITLVVVGDFNPPEAKRQIEEAFKTFKNTAFVSPPVLPHFRERLGKRVYEEERDVKITYLLMGFPTVTITHPDVYPLDVLSFILSRGRASRLFQEIKEKRGLVFSINTYSFTPAYPGGNFAIQATLDYANLKEAKKAILEELFKLKTELVSSAELARAKRQKIVEYVSGNKTVQEQAATIGLDVITTGNPNFSQVYLQNIKKVTAGEIQRVAQKYFQEEKLTLVVIKPYQKEVASASLGQKAQAKREKVKKSVLKNGLVLLLKKNATTPSVFIGAYFRGGPRFEEPSRSGIFNFMARLLLRGTKKRTAQEIAELIDSLGAEVKAGSEDDYFYLTLELLKEDIELGLRLLAELITQPAFKKEELEKERKLLLAEIKKQFDSWQSHSELLFRKTYYQAAPYCFFPRGHAESIKAITRKEIIQVHQNYCRANNMVLTIFGDIELEETRKLAEEVFGKIKKKALPLPPKLSRRELRELRKSIEKRVSTERAQAVIFLGYPGQKPGDEDWYPLRVIDSLTSGIYYPGGWLHQALREKELVYVVHAWNEVKALGGYYAIQAATAPEKLEKVLEIIKEKQALLKSKLVGKEELLRAKRNCVIMDALYWQQENSLQARRAAWSELQGLGYGYFDDYPQRIQKVTSEDIKRVANKYFQNYVLIILTPSRETK